MSAWCNCVTECDCDSGHPVVPAPASLTVTAGSLAETLRALQRGMWWSAYAGQDAGADPGLCPHQRTLQQAATTCISLVLEQAPPPAQGQQQQDEPLLTALSTQPLLHAVAATASPVLLQQLLAKVTGLYP
jgi:hypothetical protein